MERNIIKKIKTSCRFPIQCYNTVIKYNEVRKASGIAYILLELFQKGNPDDNLSETLKKFGIPEDLHYIFSSVLYELVQTKIVRTNFPVEYIKEIEYFKEIKLRFFPLTEKGKKMFAEGAIPTGLEKGKSVDICYDPVTERFLIDSNIKYPDINTSPLGGDFMNNVETDISGIEEYVKSVQTKLGLKSEEIIISAEPGEPRNMVTTHDDNLTILIKDTGVEFSFETTDERSFFDKYYSAELMTTAILAESKYKFETPAQDTIFEKIKPPQNFYIPGDIEKQAKRPGKLFIGRKSFGKIRTDKIPVIVDTETDSLLGILDVNAEFALLDLAGCRFYVPMNVSFPCENFGGRFKMQLLAEYKADDATFTRFLKTIHAVVEEKEFTDDAGRIAAYISSALDSSEYAESFARKQLEKISIDDDKIPLLLKFHELFKLIDGWQNSFKSIGSEILEKCTESVMPDNAKYKNSVLQPLREALEISDGEYIKLFSKTLKKFGDNTLVFRVLESAGFDENEILGVANIIESYTTAVLKREPVEKITSIGFKYSILYDALWKLCDMLGVKTYDSHVSKDTYNAEDFFKTYTAYKNAINDIRKYEPYAKERYSEFKRYTEIFDSIHNKLSTEKAVASDPANMTKQYIDEHIARGRYKEAITDLVIKTQYTLCLMLSANERKTLNELIDAARQSGIITQSQADMLHELRNNRNKIQHPGKNKISYDKSMIEKWRDIVFSLKPKSIN